MSTQHPNNGLGRARPAFVAVAVLLGVAVFAGPAAAAAPPNDERATPETVGPLPAVVTGDTGLGTRAADDAPIPCGVHEWTGTLWYSFTAPATEVVPLNLIAQSPSFPVAHLYRVGPAGELQAAFCLLPQRASIAVTAGETIMIMVAAPNVASVGAFELRVGRHLAPNDEAAGALTMPGTLPSEAVGDSRDATANAGDPRPSCGSAPPSTSLWYSFTPSSGGPAWFNVAASPAVNPPGAAMYAVSAAGQLAEQACSGFTSPGSQAVTLVAGQRYLVMVGPDPVFGSQGGPFTVSFTARSTGPLNDARIGASAVSSPLPATIVGDTSAATTEPSDPRPRCANGGFAGTLWYTYRPTATGSVVAQVTGSASVVTALYAVTPPTSEPNGDLNYVGCAAPKATWSLTAGNTYVVVVGHRTGAGNGGPFTLTLSPSSNVPFKVFGLVANAQARVAYNGNVATFTGPDGAASYTATVKWGDGTTSAGSIVSTGVGTFAVTGAHTYKSARQFPMTVSIKRLSNGTTKKAASTMIVSA